jgi:hypothetical protein
MSPAPSVYSSLKNIGFKMDKKACLAGRQEGAG